MISACQQFISRHGRRWWLWITLYGLMLPSIASLLVFSYYPKIDVVVMSFFRWEPPFVQDFVGLENFREAMTDPMLWDSFKLVGIILVVNLFKLWPGIFAAIALHRLRNDRLRYLLQVAFVVPMIVPGMVWLLVWKNFYDPDFGMVNRLLEASGGMRLLNWLDTAMPALAAKLQAAMAVSIDPLFGSAAGLILTAFYLLAIRGTAEQAKQMLQARSLSGIGQWARVIGRNWLIWALLILAGLLAFPGDAWRVPYSFILAIIVWALIRRGRDPFYTREILQIITTVAVTIGLTLIVLGYIWTEPTGQFTTGTPAWLGSQDLVIPAILFWGFPWVGAVGVLIYLSGLQNIPTEVYEAARLDRVSPWGMIWYIELPLILTQVRINLIFMTIGTLTGYEMFLILLGPDGGPGNRGMVPGLYMFSSAFAEGRFGYACALGMILFVIILTLTIIYQKYVRVEK